MSKNAAVARCVHRGAGRGYVKCKSCSSGTRVVVYECAVHGRCSLWKKPLDGIKLCWFCDDATHKDNNHVERAGGQIHGRRARISDAHADRVRHPPLHTREHSMSSSYEQRIDGPGIIEVTTQSHFIPDQVDEPVPDPEEPVDPEEPEEPEEPNVPCADLIGTQPAKLKYYGSDIPFVNVGLTRRPWFEAGGGFRTSMLIELDGHYPAGLYTVRWEGPGTMRAWGDFPERNISGGHATIEVTPANKGIKFDCDRPQDIKDLRVYLPTFDEHMPDFFNPDFLTAIGIYDVIRFMDWGEINAAGDIVEWSDRAVFSSMGGRDTFVDPPGVPYEVMIDLCNRLGKCCWPCVPHTADNDHVRLMAELFKGQLDPDHEIYLEYSNEVWNTTFSGQNNHIKDMGGDFHQQWANQMKRVFRIWQEVFGPESHRIKRVLATQAMLPNRTQQLMSRLDGEFDVVAVAPYYGLKVRDADRAFNASTTPEQVIARVRQFVDDTLLPNLRKQMQIVEQAEDMMSREIPLVAYEGGFHNTMRGSDKPYAKAYHDAAVDPGMYDLTRYVLDQWREIGGELFVDFDFISPESKHGDWGAKRWLQEPESTAPTYRAFKDYRAEVE